MSCNFQLFTYEYCQSNPNIFNSCGAIKSDIKETEKIIDLVSLGQQTKKRNYNFGKKQNQRRRLKDAYNADPPMISKKA